MGYSNLAEAAVGVATNNFVINGYTALWHHGLFFSKCKDLSGWKRKPPLFAPNADALVTNKGNQYYNQSQLKGLQYLAELTIGGKVERSHFDKLKKAYGKWEADFGVVDYGTNAKESNACNIFVSESIFWLYNNSQKCLNGLHKFYSAKEYWNNNPGFNRIEPSDVRVGDIAAMSNGNHVEIVTNIIRDRWLIDDGFCSRGAGRNSLSDNGKEKCDGFWNIGYTPRELEDDSNRFYRIK